MVYFHKRTAQTIQSVWNGIVCLKELVTCYCLSCRRISVVLQCGNAPMYDSNQVALRWTKSYYLRNHGLMQTERRIDAATEMLLTRQVSQSQHEKYRQATVTMKHLMWLRSGVPKREFQYAFSAVQMVNAILSKRRNFVVVEVSIR